MAVIDVNGHVIEFGVVLLHLISGEDLIGRVEYDAELKVYLITHPVSPDMHPKRGPDGQPTGASIALTRYRFFLDPDQPLVIRDSNVLFIGKLASELAEHYQNVTK
jgi:hypothetical protein